MSLLEAAALTGTTVAAQRDPASRFVQIRDLTLHHLDWGNPNRASILCIHGSAQNAHMWDFTALAFCDEYHVVAMDQRGHGDSAWADDQNYSREAYVQDLTELITALRLELPILIGLSMGGTNAIAYTASRPDSVRALIVVDVGPVPSPRGRGSVNNFVTQSDVLDSFEQFVQRVIKYSPYRPEWQIRSSLHHSLRELPDGRWTWKYDPFLRNPARRSEPNGPHDDSASRWKMWEAITCPILLIRGEHSDMLDSKVAKLMVERNQNSRLIEIPNAGHRVPGDNPIAFEQAVRKFLAGLGN